jgi:enoyl-CoA hydratase
MLVGWGRTRQIVLLGEKFSAQDALSWGLVERLVSVGELDKSVGQWLDQLLSCSPGAVRLQKQLIRSWEDMPLRAAIEAGIDRFVKLSKAENLQRQCAFFSNGRRPARQRLERKFDGPMSGMGQ